MIGVRTDVILARFTTGLPSRFEPAEGDVRIEGAVIECGSDGRATSIETFRLRESES